jgi:(S)-2-hydroxyglutarate dehydrogenase
VSFIRESITNLKVTEPETVLMEGISSLIFAENKMLHFDLCGKIIVATDEEQLPRLQNIYHRGLENGIEGLTMIGEKEIREIEPYSAGIKALHVPCAGIVDFTGVCKALERLIKEKRRYTQV